jgi:hypothetical protein
MTAVRYNGVFDDEASEAADADIVLSDLTELPRRLAISSMTP